MEGERANPMKFTYGNQFQYCQKTKIPAIAYNLGIPDLVVSEIDRFLPPISNIPMARIAPNLVIWSP